MSSPELLLLLLSLLRLYSLISHSILEVSVCPLFFFSLFARTLKTVKRRSEPHSTQALALPHDFDTLRWRRRARMTVPV